MSPADNDAVVNLARAGSAGLAAWVAEGGFWLLLVFGWMFGELRLSAIVTFLALWLLILVALPLVTYGAVLIPPFLALLDIALVLVVFKGDVRLR
jgi:hypothetical protein